VLAASPLSYVRMEQLYWCYQTGHQIAGGEHIEVVSSIEIRQRQNNLPCFRSPTFKALY
jgi:hypothetical protein